jgi:hypothetical protein
MNRNSMRVRIRVRVRNKARRGWVLPSIFVLSYEVFGVVLFVIVFVTEGQDEKMNVSVCSVFGQNHLLHHRCRNRCY